MNTRAPILERWIAMTMQTYPGATVPFLASRDDPFGNPVGHTLRQNLATLYGQLHGEMDEQEIGIALDAIIRIRAVQELTPSQAVGFVYFLKPILRELAPLHDQERLADRVDELALRAFDAYMKCREQLLEIRLNEGLRRIYAHRTQG